MCDGIVEIFGIKFNCVGGFIKVVCMCDVVLVYGIDMFVMVIGGLVLVDIEVLYLVVIILDYNCYVVWVC